MTSDSDRIQHLERTLVDVRRDVTKHEHAIYGNGTPGLRTQVSVLESGKRQTQGTLHMAISITGVIIAIGSTIVAIVAAWAGAPATH